MSVSKEFKILIAIEDSEQEREIIDVLGKRFLIETAIDSEDAYHKIHKLNPDVAILDYPLSKINTINLYEGLEFVHSTVHYVICVTHENFEVARRAWHRRAIDFIMKPFDTERFIQDVNKIVRYVLDRREVHALRREVKQLRAQVEELKEKE